MSTFRICTIGDYDKSYIRNDVVLSGFIRQDHQIYECHTERKGIMRIYDLWKKMRHVPETYDFVFIPSSDTSRAIVLLCRLFIKKPIVWDAYYSIYDSWIYDRKLVRTWSIKAAYYWLLEFVTCRVADIILLDTNEHIDYFKKTFRVSKNKFVRVFVGASQEKLSQSLIEHKEIKDEIEQRFSGKKIVYFQGKFIPLQGIEYIVEAANLLRDRMDIVFLIVGKGQTYNAIQELVKEKQVHNMFFIGRVPYGYLSSYITSADICLGIFGNTDKAERVIPSKVYEYVALSASVITSDTPAIRELFGEEDLFLCRRADGKALSEAIVYALQHEEERKMKGMRGNRIFTMYGEMDIIAKNLTHALHKKLYDR